MRQQRETVVSGGAPAWTDEREIGAAEGFERVTRLASRVLGVPVALVTLLDGDGQETTTSLLHSLCRHAIISRRPLAIDDLRTHPVEGDALGIIAYAGFPLISSDGDVLGSLCAIDMQPRAWSDSELETLGDLAALAVTELELRLARTLPGDWSVEQLKDDFVATVSHELRTPLAGVYGAAVTLVERGAALPDDRQRALLAMIVSESERLAQRIDEILFAGHVRSLGLGLRATEFDPETLARDVLDAAAAAAPALRFELRLEGRPHALAADVDNVRTILVKLVDNAIKYGPAGGVIEVVVAATAASVRFLVHDRGPGIPEHEQRRVFDRFYRLDPGLLEGIGGAGLGLYVSRELVRRMGGRMWVESRSGRGSTFGFELPATIHE